MVYAVYFVLRWYFSYYLMINPYSEDYPPHHIHTAKRATLASGHYATRTGRYLPGISLSAPTLPSDHT